MGRVDWNDTASPSPVGVCRQVFRRPPSKLAAVQVPSLESMRETLGGRNAETQSQTEEAKPGVVGFSHLERAEGGTLCEKDLLLSPCEARPDWSFRV